MDKNMTLEKRIAAELYSYHGQMSVFVDDLRGHTVEIGTVEIGADEPFETASTIKAYILAALYWQAERGKADLDETITYRPEHFVDGSGMLRALGVGAALKVRDAATMMIICSDNIATNMVIDYLGRGWKRSTAVSGRWALPTLFCTTPCTLTGTTSWALPPRGTMPLSSDSWPGGPWSAGRPAPRCCPSSGPSTTTPC